MLLSGRTDYSINSVCISRHMGVNNASANPRYERERWSELSGTSFGLVRGVRSGSPP